MYYFDDEKIFTSKIKALEYEKISGLKANFYYHDDIYSRVNWKLEPPETLDYYYKEQAQRIRDKYDYIILCYSGGYDSTNILETFYYNNIKLDKIVMVGALSQDSSSGVDENHNGELYHNAFPHIEKLGLESITQVYDYTKLFNDISQFSITKYCDEWADNMNGWFSPHNFFWKDAEKYFVPKEYKSKKIAMIFGKDKPYIFIENRKFGFRFKDICISSYGDKNITSDINCDRIYFYWDPEYPEILIKQLHLLLKRYILSRFQMSVNPLMGHDIINNVSINDIIYNLKTKLIYKSPKSASKLLSLRDQYLLKNKNSDIYKFHEVGINLLKTKMSHNEISNMPPIDSRFYSII